MWGIDRSDAGQEVPEKEIGMTQEQAVRELQELRTCDSEYAHSEADRILVKVLRSNGLGAVADAFEQTEEAVTFWYS